MNAQVKRKLSSKELAQEVLSLVSQSLVDDKAEDIMEIDLEGKTDFARYMVIATGRSARHVSSMADKLADKLIAHGMDELQIEGIQKGDWVLIDANDVIIHVFRAEIRELYNIEKIWERSIAESL